MFVWMTYQEEIISFRYTVKVRALWGRLGVMFANYHCHNKQYKRQHIGCFKSYRSAILIGSDMFQSIVCLIDSQKLRIPNFSNFLELNASIFLNHTRNGLFGIFCLKK